MNSTRNSFYRSNGSGRDHYIAYNSGGFWTDTKPIRAKQSVNWATYIPDYRSDRNKTASIPKFTHYYGNGTGRDCYIIAGNGGMTKQFKRKDALCLREQILATKSRNQKLMTQKMRRSRSQNINSRSQSQACGRNGGIGRQSSQMRRSPSTQIPKIAGYGASPRNSNTFKIRTLNRKGSQQSRGPLPQSKAFNLPSPGGNSSYKPKFRNTTGAFYSKAVRGQGASGEMSSPRSYVLSSFDGMLKGMNLLERSGRFNNLGIRKKGWQNN